MADEFGDAYAAVLVTDLSLAGLSGMTAQQGLDAGRAPRDIWLALCEAMDVPDNRRYGAGRLEPKK